MQFQSLVRNEPNHNIYRYYTVTIQPDLFGTWSVLREWGRMGRHGTIALTGGLTYRDASASMMKLVKRKQSRGYVGRGG